MDQDDLKAIVESEIQSASGQALSKIVDQRETALQYYLGEPLGNELEGRSQVVSTDVADTIEWIMPSLLKIFTSGDQVVVFDPTGKEDEDWAEQSTDYCNYVIQKDNNGFEIFYIWFKDALLSKTGTVKYWWDDSPIYQRERYQGLTDTELSLLMDDPDYEILAHADRTIEIVDPSTGQTTQEPAHDITVRCKKPGGRVCVEVVPPEEFIITRRAKTSDPQQCDFCGQQTMKRRSDLVAMGYERDLVDSLTSDPTLAFNQEKTQRRSYDDDTMPDMGTALEMNKANEPLLVYDLYLKVDFDDDGLSEWRHVVYVGKEILTNEEAPDGPQFAAITPILMPHKFHGLSIADLVMDLQQIKTQLLRNALDNQYLINNSRTIVLEDQVNIDDILVNRPGGIIREKVMGACRPYETASLGPSTLPMIEYIDSARENRTGVTKYNQGLDANSLNKTASGINAIQNAAQQRIELIARVFAETGVRALFKGMLKLICRYQDKPRTIRLRNTWVDFDPRNFDPEMDVTVTVGLGTGNKDQNLVHLQTIMQIQQAMMAGGLNGVTVTAENLYNSASKVVENAGFKEVEAFFTDPKQPDGTMRQQPPPPPPPDLAVKQQALQVDAQDKQTQAQLKAQELALKDKDISLSHEREIAKINLQHRQMDQQAQQAQQQHDTDTLFRRKELGLKAKGLKQGAVGPDGQPQPQHEDALHKHIVVHRDPNTGAIVGATELDQPVGDPNIDPIEQIRVVRKAIQINRDPQTGEIIGADIIEVDDDPTQGMDMSEQPTPPPNMPDPNSGMAPQGPPMGAMPQPQPAPQPQPGDVPPLQG